MSLVSVVIPTYNYARFLCGAIDSVLAQTYPNLEIIVVDDGSTDNTSVIIKPYLTRINYIYQSNRGLSAARNTGIHVAKGAYVAFLDSDDIWLPDKISEQMKVFESSEVIGAVACNFLQVNENLDILNEIKNINYQRDEFRKRIMLGNILGGGGSNILVRKSCFDTVGLFDEKLKSSEDWDMWLRISEKFEIKILEKSMVKIRVGSYSMSSVGNAQKMLDNELLVLKKHVQGARYFHAVSNRFFSAAWAFSMQGQNNRAIFCMFKCFLFYPLALFHRNKLGLFLKILKNYMCRKGAL